MLSYEDLGLLLTAKPSELHDSIARALDLDALTSAVGLLRDRAAPLKLPLKQAGQDRRALRSELADVDDDRARAAQRLLGRTSPDLAALEQLATGPTVASGPLQTCQRILAVEIATLETVESVARELDIAREELTGVGEQRSRAAALRDQLLLEAIDYHQAAGDTECPVCGTGSLDGDWRRRTEAALAENDLLLDARGEAERRHRKAAEAVRQLIGAAPTILGQTDVSLSSQHRVVEAWGAWDAMSANSSSEAHAEAGDQILARYQALAEGLAAWQNEAQSLAAALTERWSPYALRIAQLVADFTSALAQNEQAATLDAARVAADEVAQRLRTDRLNPIVDRTKQIWQQLRQESNVRLEEIELTGRGNRRTVDIKAVVDDAAGSSALSVMSQGELNSLALALYLPRATSEDSPFRFLVLDDPVQAMDPTKVDGLAAVLADLAKTRQVVVFSHDDRFAQAARRLPSPPTILSVRRGRQSEVIVQAELRPVERHLKDAHAVLQEPNLEETIQRRVIPGILRQAIEAAAWRRYVDERLAAGDRLDDLERAWEDAQRTRARLELLLGPRLDGWLRRDERRPRALVVCNKGTHQPMTGDLGEAYEDAKAVSLALENKHR